MSSEHTAPVSLKGTFQWMSPWIAVAIKPNVFEFHVLKKLGMIIWETKISLYIIVSMWSLWVYWGYLKNKNYSSRADFFFFYPSLVIFHQFLTISALENNNSVLEHLKDCFCQWPYKTPSLLAAISSWPSVLEHTLVHNYAVALNLAKPPLELYPHWLNLHKRLRFHPWYTSLHDDNVSCSLQPPTSPLLPTLHSAEQLG